MLLLTLLFLLPALTLLLIRHLKTTVPTTSAATHLPKSYPIIGSLLAFNRKDRLKYISDLLRRSPTSTFVLHVPFSGGARHVLTASPDVVRHVLKDNFHNYQKGHALRSVLGDLLGEKIFNVDGPQWKFQRQVASHEFNTRSLRRFVEKVVDTEVGDRLVPLMAKAASDDAVLDLQDVLQRFAFDNICKIAFGYDPEYLSLSLSDSSFAAAFDDAVSISGKRFRSFFPIQWKLKKLLGIDPSENRLKEAVSVVRGFAIKIVRQKKQEMMTLDLHQATPTTMQEEDLLSRFLKSGHSDEQFVADIVISFILGGRDTTSASLTWFFWLLSNNPHVELELLDEIKATTNHNHHDTKTTLSPYEEAKEMVYAHACLCESMRLYPPVPGDMKEAVQDDVLPDGTRVRRGEKVTYYAYAMGRLERIWGGDWAKFRPERWLEKGEEGASKWRFVKRDPFEYPVFHAGPRVCLGKEMAFLQMKRVVAGVLRRFKVVPMMEVGFEPIFVFNVSSKMKGGLPVRFEERKVAI